MSKLTDYVNANGRFPPIKLRIVPLDTTRPPIEQVKFLSYNFSSSIMTPVDSFTFTFTNPTLTGSIYDYIQEGDTAELIVGDKTVATGQIDVVDIDTSTSDGEIVTISGRDLIGQLEDQNAVSINDEPIWANSSTIQAAVARLIESTKIKGLILQNAPSGNFLFATEPSENKISSLVRFVEPLNCVFWSSPEGKLVVGKPNMAQAPAGELYCDRANRVSNVLQMKATFSSTQIPNIMVPIWSGQETVQARVSPEQRLNNASTGPTRLRKLGFLVPRAVVVSNPEGASPQGLADVNAINQAGSANILQAYAKREMARMNVGELIVQAVVAGHCNNDLIPFQVDQCYKITYPRASISEKMYLYAVNYIMDRGGQRTTLEFCKLGRIVADVAVSETTPTNVPRSSLR